VILTITNSNGCVNTITKTVQVLELPVAEFTTSTGNCSGSPVQFTDQSTSTQGYINQWSWDFGDGTPVVVVNYPTPPNVTHIYATAGTYNAILTVQTTDGCSNSVTHPVSVTTGPTANYTYSSDLCLGVSVQFTDISQSNGGGAITTWLWNFGDPASGTNNTSTLQHPAHTFVTAGPHTVQLTVTNINNCTNTTSQSVVIDALPVVDFTATTPCLGTATVFTDASSAPAPATIATWDWDFGDGSAHATIQNPTHTFTQSGAHSVILTITNSNGCVNTITKTVQVIALPVAAFTTNTGNCAGSAVQFTDQSTTTQGYINQWSWDFGDGSAPVVISYPASPNVTHTYPTAGVYLATLTVQTTDGCSNSVTHSVSVTAGPVANYSFTQNTCFGSTVQFTDNSQTNGAGAISSWLWNFNDPTSGANNTSTQPNPSHIFTAAGTYSVTLTITNINGCTNAVSKSVVIVALPVANFTATAPCLGTATTFTDTSIPNATSIATWDWDFGDGSVHATTQNPTHTFALAGSHSVILTVTNSNGCVHAITKTVQVIPLPTAAFTTSPTNCAGSSVQFTDQSTASQGYINQWSWNFGDGSAPVVILYPASPNVTHTYAASGVYTAILTVQTTDGCTASISHYVTVTAGPVANYTFTDNPCRATPVQFTDVSQTNGAGPINSWLWNFDDPASGTNNTSTLANPSHSFATSGTHSVTLTVTNVSNCTSTKSTLITVNSLPVANFNADAACLGLVTTFTDLSVANATGITGWNWDFGDGSVHSTLQNPTHLYNNPGIYYVSLLVTNSNQCIHDTTLAIEVIQGPGAEFSSTAPNCFGSPVSYTDISTTPHGLINRWVWDFGDGTSQTILYPASPNVTHLFAGNAMQHTVRLTVTTNDGCTSYKEHLIVSIPKPAANFTYSAMLCQGVDITFTDLSQAIGGSDIVTWNWNFGDPGSGVNNFSTLTNPSHIFTAAGTYSVTLTVTNDANCTDTLIQAVAIAIAPVANFTADTACSGSFTSFTDLSTPNAASILRWEWNFGDGTQTIVNYPNPPSVTHLYAGSGSYQVTLTVHNSNGCINAYTKTVVVLPQPVAEFTIASQNCANAPVIFADQSQTNHGFIVRWTWQFGDGKDTTITNPSSNLVPHTYATGGVYNVTLTVKTSDSCSISNSHPVTVNYAPLASFGNSATQCKGTPVQFTDMSQTNGGATITQWLWDFGDPASGISNSSTLQDPTHLFATSGTHSVTLTVTNSNNCASSASKQVNVFLAPVATFSSTVTCSASPVTFTDNSIPNASSIFSWDWNFGDGTPHSNLQNPTHVYLNPGQYHVTLQVRNSNQCVHDTTMIVTVYTLPQAAFATNAPLCTGAPVYYTNQSTTPHGWIVRWIWDFGDGTTQTVTYPNSPNVSHIFQGAATQHTVRLTIVNSDSCSHYTEQIIISAASPMANFIYPVTLCNEETVNFTDISQLAGGGPISSWNWNFGDPTSGTSNVSSLQNPIHAFTAAGSFDVRLIVVNTGSCRDTIIKTLTISNKPLADFRADTTCFGSITHFYDLSAPSTTIVAWDWDFGDGTPHSHLKDPQHLYATPGVFVVTLTVTNLSGCKQTVQKQIRVNQAPVSAFSYANANCSGSPVAFNDLSYTLQGYIIKWTWTFGDGTDTTIYFPGPQNVSHIYANGGNYNVSLTVKTSDSCSNSVTHQVPVGAAPLANFSFAADRCQTAPVAFQDLSQASGGGQITSWLWDFGDPTSGAANQSTLKNPSHTYQSGGSYQVLLRVGNINNCFDTILKTVSINNKPNAHYSADTVCKGDSTQFTDLSVPNSGTISARLWDFGDGTTSTLQNPKHLYSAAGIYTVSLTIFNSLNCQDDTVGQVLVKPGPTAMFTQTGSCMMSTTQFTDQSTTATGFINAWLWDFSDGATSTLQNPTHVFATGGTYTVTLTVTNSQGCSSHITMPVPILMRPVASFAAYSAYCPAGRVSFSDHSTTSGAPIVGWYWLFEPGFYSTAPNPTYTFDVTNTTYPVTLIVTDANGCSDTVVQDVYVLPGFLFNITATTVCIGNTTQFSAVNLAPNDTLHDLRWDFGEPASGTNNYSTLYAPSHTYLNPGTYTAKLRAYNSNNCVDSVYKQVVVNPLPIPSFTYGDIPYCDTIVTFTHQSSGNGAAIDSLRWIFGDGDIIIKRPPISDTVVHKFHGFGIFDVNLTVYNANGCQREITKKVTVACIAAHFYEKNALNCSNLPITLVDTSGPRNLIKRWYWDFGDGSDTTYTVYTTDMLKHQYPLPGDYTVTLAVSSSTGATTLSDTLRRTITVKIGPTANYSISAVCSGDTTRFINLSDSNGATIISNYWKFGDPVSAPKDTSTALNTKHLYPTSGYFHSMLVVGNRIGCYDTLKKDVRVYLPPDANFTSTLACTRDKTYFSDQTIPGDTTTYKWLWRFGDPSNPTDSSTQQEPDYIYNSTGSYVVYFKVEDKFGCWDTVTHPVKVLASPLSSFSIVENVDGVTGKVRMQNGSLDATSYIWNFGNGVTSTDENPIVIYKDDGSYLIELVCENQNLCTDTTFLTYEFLFHNLYVPNLFSPTSMILDVRYFKPVGMNLSQYHVTVYDMAGHLLWESNKLDAQGSPVEGWDGTVNGNLMQQDTYIWKISAVFKDGKVWEGTDMGKGSTGTMGTVTLVR
jgi:PKD repeat protein